VRNRIVAALAQATVVVEATRRSGALITADHALAIGRDVLAVPGAPWLELGGGTLALLRAGAAPVGSAADVLDALGVQMELPPARLEPPTGVGGVLWAELRRQPRRRDALALATGLTADIANAALAELELDGLVVEERDGTLSALEPGRTRPVNSSSEGA
jgi:DNA processing protein